MSTSGADDALPNVSHRHLEIPAPGKLAVEAPAAHRPRILLLYGSLRARSYSRFLAFEAARLLETFGAETRIFDPQGLPLPDGAPDTHPKVQELRDLAAWSEGQVWCSPERHGAMSGVMKSMIDWIPLSVGAVRPTQGKTLAVMQVSGGSQSFNAVNQMRVLGRWMRMITIPNQSSVAKVFQEFDEAGRMNLGLLRSRRRRDGGAGEVHAADRDRAGYLVDRYSERKESAEELSRRVNLPAARIDEGGLSGAYSGRLTATSRTASSAQLPLRRAACAPPAGIAHALGFRLRIRGRRRGAGRDGRGRRSRRNGSGRGLLFFECRAARARSRASSARAAAASPSAIARARRSRASSSRASRALCCAL